jgi:hypothetical protein
MARGCMRVNRISGYRIPPVRLCSSSCRWEAGWIGQRGEGGEAWLLGYDQHQLLHLGKFKFFVVRVNKNAAAPEAWGNI